MNRDRAIPRTISSFFSSPTSKKSKLTDHESDSSSRLTDPSSVSSTLPSLSCHDDDFSLVELTTQPMPLLIPLSMPISPLQPIIINNVSTVSSSSIVSPSTILSSSSTASTTSPLAYSPSTSSLVVDISQSPVNPPSQPILSKHKTNEDNRSFQQKWYIGRPWLEYSIINDCAYCYYCRHFCSTNNLINRNQSDSFIKGFRNWKYALENKRGFKQHEISAVHITAKAAYQEFVFREKAGSTVANVIDKGRKEQIRKNHSQLTKISSTILLCNRQMIPLRGHDEDLESNNKGNFLEILHWSSQTDSIVKSILEDSASNATYLSPQIQNELLHLMSDQIRNNISEKVKNKSYALLADESRDISGHEQMSIIIRTIDESKIKSSDSFIEEHFLGLIALELFDASSLANAIVNLLKNYSIDLSLCIGICFDGASVMSGKNAGLQAILRENFMPNAIYVHCYVHRLNLVIVHVSLSISYLNEFYRVLSKIHEYFTASGVTNRYFREAQCHLKLAETNLKRWADIRWDSRWTSINAIIKNYRAIVLAFTDLIDNGGKQAVDARGLIVCIKQPMFIVTLFILHRLLGPIKILSDQLKEKSLDYSNANQLIISIIEEFNQSRTEKCFEEIYEMITGFCEDNEINLNQEIKSNRKRVVSIRFKDSVIESSVGQRDDNENKDYYRTHIYYQLIDNILVELNNRFSSKNLQILSSISSLCPNNDNFLNFDTMKFFADHLKFDLIALCNELNVVKPMFKKQSISNIIDFYRQLHVYREAFPVLISVMSSALTIPVSSTTCERTFSKMKKIKTAVRSTMSDDRLSDLCVLAVERTTDINFEQLVDDFSNIHKNSRIMLK